VELKNKKILITGASGFVGSRLCEVLAQRYQSNELHCLVRNMGLSARIGRLPVRFLRGDITDQKYINSIVPGFDIIVHLATGGDRGIIDGTRFLAGAALAARVERFVHMSTASVYGLKSDTWHVEEGAPLRKSGNEYCDAKLEAEKVISQYINKGLPVVVLRPRIVFGPYSQILPRVIQEIKSGKLIMVDNGEGACNTVYIDNLIHAILLAIQVDQAVGGTFFITDGEELTWRQFKMAFTDLVESQVDAFNVSSAEMLKDVPKKPGWFSANIKGIKNVLMSREVRTEVMKIPALTTMIETVMNLPMHKKMWIKDRFGALKPFPGGALGDNPQVPVDQVLRESGKGFSKIDQARSILKYEPVVSFGEGVEITKKWVKQSGLV
jgi:nucleoside-diphosphate-sugar epimerase